jgi:siroheme synthase-like protein
MSAPLLPLFLKLEGRPVLLVGGGGVAAVRLAQLLEAGARVTVVAPSVRPEIAASGAAVRRRPFRPSDLDGVWLAVAAATPAVGREVARAAVARRIFVNAVDDPRAASAYTGGVLRRGDVAVAVSTGGRAPALAGLLRRALGELLPESMDAWLTLAERLRLEDRTSGVPLPDRRLRLLQALVDLETRAEPARVERSTA